MPSLPPAARPAHLCHDCYQSHANRSSGSLYYCFRNSQVCHIQNYHFGVSGINHSVLDIIIEGFSPGNAHTGITRIAYMMNIYL